MRRTLRWTIALAALAAWTDPARAQHLEAETPGLHAVRALLPEAGVLWAATDAGLLRWDLGTNPPGLERIDPRRSGLPSTRISSVARGPDGALWVGTRDRGLACFDGKSWSLYTVKNTGTSGLASDGIRGLLPLSVGVRKELWVLDGSNSLDVIDAPHCGSALDMLKRRTLPSPQGDLATIQALDADAIGVVWLAANGPAGALAFSDSGTGIQASAATGLPADPNTAVSSIVLDMMNRPWIGTSVGAYHLEGGPTNLFFHGYTTDNGLLENDIADMTVDKTLQIWALTRNFGPAVLIGSTFQPRSVGLTGATFSAAGSSRTTDVGVWFGTLDQGAANLDLTGTPVQTVDVPPQPACSSVTAVIEEPVSHAVWVGCDGQGLSRFDNAGGWTLHNTLNTPNMTSNFITSAALEPSANILWFGTRGGGALRVRISDQSFLPSVGAGQGVPLNVTSVAVGPTSEKWFGSDTQGACRIPASATNCDPPVTIASGLLSNDIRGIAVLPTGKVWFSTPGALSLYAGTPPTMNVASGSHPPGDFTQDPFPGGLGALSLSADGSILCAATAASGAACLAPAASGPPQWHSLTDKNGLPSNAVLSLGFDPGSVLWIGTDSGLVQTSDFVVLDRIDAEDGLPDEHISVVRPTSDATRPGVVRLGTKTGGLVTLEDTMLPGVHMRPWDDQQPLRSRAVSRAEVSCSSVRVRWDPYLGPRFSAYQVRRREMGQLVPVPASVALGLAAAGLLLGSALLLLGRRRLPTAALALLLGATPTLPLLGLRSAGGDVGFSLLGTVARRSTTRFDDITAQGGRLYRYRVDVALDANDVVTGTELDVPVQGVVPVAPELKLDGMDPNSVHLSWSALVTNAGCLATGLQLYTVPDVGAPQKLGELIQSTAAGDAFVGPVQPQTRHRYAIAAVNAFGQYELSPVVDVTTPGALGVPPGQCRPPAPRRLQARAVAKDRVELRFVERGPNASCPTLGFKVYRVQDPLETSVTTVGAGQSRALVTGLAPNTQYQFRVRAIGHDDESDGSPIGSVRTRPDSVTVVAPGDVATTPTGLIVALGESIGIQWRRGSIRFTQVVRDRGELVNAFGLPRADFTAESWAEDTSSVLPHDPVPDLGAGHGGLLAYFGTQPVFIGDGGCFEAPAAGALSLGPNDGTPIKPNDPNNYPDVGDSEEFVVEVFRGC
jgi:ligand-binding sensor domain-containing protein